MRILLAIIAAFALVGTFFFWPFAGAGVGCFTIFVVAGTGAAVLEHLVDSKKEAKRQTALLEQIARQTAPPGSPATKESAASYHIPGIS